jgi:ankyrin repeat protein
MPDITKKILKKINEGFDGFAKAYRERKEDETVHLNELLVQIILKQRSNGQDTEFFNMVRFVVEQGGQVNAVFNSNMTSLSALFRYTFQNNTEMEKVNMKILRFLLNQGAIINDFVYREICFINFQTDKAALLLLLKRGLNATKALRECLETVFVDMGDLNDWLRTDGVFWWKHGADINVKDRFGRTIFLIAFDELMQENNEEIGEILMEIYHFLIERGWNPSIRDNAGRTALSVLENALNAGVHLYPAYEILDDLRERKRINSPLLRNEMQRRNAKTLRNVVVPSAIVSATRKAKSKMSPSNQEKALRIRDIHNHISEFLY